MAYTVSWTRTAVAALASLALLACGASPPDAGAGLAAVTDPGPAQVSVASGPVTTPPLLLMPLAPPVETIVLPRRQVAATPAPGLRAEAARPWPEGARPVTPIPFLKDFVGIGLGIFDATGKEYVTRWSPPDPTGAVGASHYVQMVNSSFAVFDKDSGALLLGPLDTNTLFQRLGGLCATTNAGDPSIVYDQLANRWVLSQFAHFGPTQTSGFLECVAVSTTSDPRGSWHLYAFDYPAFNDYPQLAVWPDAYYVTYNMFTRPGSAGEWMNTKVCAFDRANMLDGKPAIQVCRDMTTKGVMLAANLSGRDLPPAGSPAWLLGLAGTIPADTLRLATFRVNFGSPASSVLTELAPVPVDAYEMVCNDLQNKCVTQPVTTQLLDSVGDRLMNRLVYRNFGTHRSMVATHTITAGTGSGIRWYELRIPDGGNPAVHQSGTVAVDAQFRFLPSIALDRVGNVAVGYSVSSLAIRPRISVSGRLVTDPTGTMPQGESTMYQGPAYQTDSDRWGDYASMTVDPDDECGFYYLNEYVSDRLPPWVPGTNPPARGFSWATRIGYFSFPNCVKVADFTIAASPPDLVLVPPATGTSTISTARLGIGGTVALEATFSPVVEGLTAALGSASIQAGESTTLTVSAAVGVPAGAYVLTVKGTEGAFTHSTVVNVTIGTPPDFTISTSPTTLSVAQGASGGSTVSVGAVGASTAVGLSAVVSPAGSGVTAAVSPTSVTTGGTASLTVTATGSATPGTYTVTVTGTGTGGVHVHSATVGVTVPAPVPPTPTPTPAPPSGGGGCSTGGEAGASLLPVLALLLARRVRRKGT